ncbi:MAG: hypothetical protein AB1591_02920 [Pseudomonadota bacterium]
MPVFAMLTRLTPELLRTPKALEDLEHQKSGAAGAHDSQARFLWPPSPPAYRQSGLSERERPLQKTP